MKTLLVILAAISLPAMAEAPEKVVSLLKSLAPGTETRKFEGIDDENQKCALFVTKDAKDLARESYFVVVARDPSDREPTPLEYIGVSTAHDLTKTFTSGSQVTFKSTAGWSSESMENTITITFDRQGNPVAALGFIDTLTVNCKLSKSI